MAEPRLFRRAAIVIITGIREVETKVSTVRSPHGGLHPVVSLISPRPLDINDIMI